MRAFALFFLLWVTMPCKAQESTSVFLDSTTVKEVLGTLEHFKPGAHSGDNVLSVYEYRGTGTWVKKEDIANLVKLIQSGEKCRCIMGAFSSSMPATSDYATIGGIAMDMIDNYRGNMKFPDRTLKDLKDGQTPYPVWYRCPKLNAERIKEIENWYSGTK